MKAKKETHKVNASSGVKLMRFKTSFLGGASVRAQDVLMLDSVQELLRKSSGASVTTLTPANLNRKAG